MKTLTFTFFLAFLNIIGFAQKSNIFRIDSLPKQGVLLDKGWKWHEGDNLDWARSNFDDSEWEDIDLTKNVNDLSQLKKNGKFFWLRLTIKMDTLINKNLALILVQNGASEIYLNGNLIKSLGILSNNPTEIKSFSPEKKPILFHTDKKNIQVLAVRYAFQQQITYTSHWGAENPVFACKINNFELSNDTYISENQNLHYKNSYFRAGILSILFVLFFSLYLFFPSRKVNLYFSLYALMSAIVWYVWVYIRLPGFTENYYFNNNCTLALQAISYIFMLAAVYEVLNFEKKWIFWLQVVFGLITIPVGALYYNGWLLFGQIFSNIINFDITRIATLAHLRKKKGAWILVVGGVSYLICWFLFTLNFLKIAQIDVGFDLFNVSLITIPLAFAIFVGYEFGFTNRLLQQKLNENELLFTEKQNILSSQNETLEKQVSERTSELEKTLYNLKSTQAQLIQSEKMASLGELTAGIAHEIQNPLNFVNNFSELSVDLVKELKEEAEKSELDKNLILELAADLSQNQEKINLHGKRASSIVKGMLEHSRKSSGTKELTDINALADEYLRLAYHGLRAKDKDFNADFETHFEPNLPKIEIIPQDMGRVILNLINNAFWAVNDKKIKSDDSDFKPKVIVSTKTLENCIEISIKDNGSGIPDGIKDKIFQPFFTTKPTGQGTGLGLSLSYDIVKAHGGELKLESQEGEGSAFIVLLKI